MTSKSYSPFGEQIGEQRSGFGYNGEYYNAATWMIYLRARFYAPEMNRFSQKDLLRGSISSPQTLNRYKYCYNDPVNYVDPSGQLGILGIAAIVGAAVGAVVGTVKSIQEQKANGDGSVSVGKVIRDAAIGAAVGAVGAVAAVATGTVLVSAVGTTTITGAAALTVSQSIGVAAMSSVAGGMTARYYESALNNTFAPEKPKTNPVREAFNTKAMARDAAIGMAFGAVTHFANGGIYETPASREYDRAVKADARATAQTKTQNNSSSDSGKTGSSNDPAPQPKNSSTSTPKVQSPQSEAATGCGGSGFENRVKEYATAATKGPSESKKVFLGKYIEGSPSSYEQVAIREKAQYFDLDNWEELRTLWSKDEIWKINEQFLIDQINAGKDIYLTTNPYAAREGSYFFREIEFLIQNGYKFVKEGDVWRAIK